MWIIFFTNLQIVYFVKYTDMLIFTTLYCKISAGYFSKNGT